MVNTYTYGSEGDIVSRPIPTITTGLFVGTDTSKISLAAAADRTLSTYSTCALTSGSIATVTVDQTMTVAGTHTVEVAQFILTSAVGMGAWANAILGKVDLSTAGKVTGLVGVICGELDMPSGACSGGTYSVFEAEINCPTGYTGGVPINAFEINSWGAQKARFDTYGNLFEITGLSVGSGKIFQTNTAADATHALRCRVDGVSYYIMMTSVGA